ncbi:MAG: heparin lyase I family protein [Candidatus Latescibacterota bacterium]
MKLISTGCLATLFLTMFCSGSAYPQRDTKGNTSPGQISERVLLSETFEDTNWASRGWYDGPRMRITAEEHIPGSGHSCEWHWEKAGAISPAGGAARVKIGPVRSVTLSFSMKHSADWKWTGVAWHPHELHFLTTEDDPTVGPAYTHLTFYIEAVNGVPRVSIQDGRNIDESRVKQNLVGITERRAVAGGNGDSDGYGEGDCYPVGNVHRNGKSWVAGKKLFSDDPGPFDKNRWHHVKVTLALNSIRGGIGQRDGVIKYWFDGELVIDHDDVVFRTGAHPDMKINQFMMAPYYGPGVPHPQTIWVDDIRITTDER